MQIEEVTNRRNAPRRSVRMLCQAVRERDFKLIGEVALDLSADGMLVRTALRVLTGEEILVSFFEPHDAVWYDLSATVARVVHARRTSDAERCVALEFHAMTVAQRRRLKAAVAARRPASGEAQQARPWRDATTVPSA